jgi:CcmD family protein
VTVAYAAVWIAIGSYWLHVHRTLKRARARYEHASLHAGAKRGGTSHD